jgi:hypothetical protein
MRVLRISVLITITIWSAEAISPGVIRRQHEISAHPPIVTATPTPTFHNELNYARYERICPISIADVFC